MQELDYKAHLERRLAAAGSLPKRERTRERLRIALIQVLDQKGYLDMRAVDVTQAADLAEGSFYVYFRSKVDITLDVLRTFFLDFLDLQHSSKSSMGRFEAIQAANRRWLAVAYANPGIMRCLLQTANEVPEIAAFADEIDGLWSERIRQGVQRRRGVDVPILAVKLLSGMMDELTRRLVVYRDEDLFAKMATVGAGYLDVADAASAIWYRILYPDLPLDAPLSPAARALAG